MADHRERTFIMIKPDGVQRGLVGKIISRFEKKGFKLVAMKFMQASQGLLEKHYEDLSGRPFFPGLVKYMQMGPVVPMVWEGLNIVKTGRDIIGATNPMDSQPGSLRGDLCIQVGRKNESEPKDKNRACDISIMDLSTSFDEFLQRMYTHRKRRNIIHGSDSLPSAEKEISLWFKEEELCNYKMATDSWVYED